MSNARPLLWIFVILNSLAFLVNILEEGLEGWKSNIQLVTKIVKLICTIGLVWILISRAPLDKE